MERNQIPIWQKQNLTVAEAAEYSNIGVNRLNALLDDVNCPFRLMVGRKRLIKRILFDKFIEQADMV